MTTTGLAPRVGAVAPRTRPRTADPPPPARLPETRPGARAQALAVARQRLALGILLFLGLGALAALRLVDLALAGPVEPSSRLAGPRGAMRADIVDRHGQVLATSYEAYALAVRPHDLVREPEVLARRLAQILGADERELLAGLTSRSRFRYLARRILPEEGRQIRALGEPGLMLEREPDRLYPHGALAVHLVGYAGLDGEGASGIERAFDERLRDPEHLHRPLVLALDARVQQALEGELAQAMERQRAIGAAGVIMDVDTGEVVAMASLPSYNANAPGALAGSPDHMNRATLGVYELGSTFKAFTIAMGLDEGTIKGLDELYPTAPIAIGRHRIRDMRPRSSAYTVPEVLIFSSNVATARMAEALGQQRQEAYLRRLGFLDRAPGEIEERGRALYPSRANWGQSAVMTIGFGHSLAVTPLHLAAGYAALVNGGVWRPATFLAVPEGHEVPGRRVFTPETSATMNAMLRLAVTQGTGRNADAPGYRVGGKTGTAEKLRETGGYDRGRNITTFAGAFPMDRPRYVVIAMLDDARGDPERGGGRTAGSTVGPAFRQIVLRVAPMLGVRPDLAAEPDVSPMAGLYPERRR